MGVIHQPHDKFFKEMFGNVDLAKEFMVNYLPSDILKVIDLQTIVPQSPSYIEGNLKESFSDLLFKVNINNEEGYIYFLFEHKSYPSKKIALQLLNYMVRIWEDKTLKHNKNKLPVIIPMTVYHGKKGWDIGVKLSDLMEGYKTLPEEVKKYIPDYEYLIYDISSYTDEEIKGNVKLKVVMKILKNIFKSDEEFFKIFKEAVEVLDKLEKQEKGIEYFRTFIYYVLNVRNEVNLKDIYDLVKEISVERSEDIMTIADELRKEGMEKGIEKGIEKGKLEEKKEVARNLLGLGVEVDKIIKATGLTEEDIKKLLS